MSLEFLGASKDSTADLRFEIRGWREVNEIRITLTETEEQAGARNSQPQAWGWSGTSEAYAGPEFTLYTCAARFLRAALLAGGAGLTIVREVEGAASVGRPTVYPRGGLTSISQMYDVTDNVVAHLLTLFG